MGIACWNGEVKCGALARHGFQPDLPVISLHDLLANCKTDTRAWVLAGVCMQSPEYSENSLMILGGDANPVILNRKLAESILPFRSDSNGWPLVIFSVFERVRNQILK